MMTSRSSLGSRGQELDAQLRLEGRLLGLRLGDDLAGQLAELRVALRVALPARRGELLADGSQASMVLHDGRDLRLLATEGLAALRVDGDLRAGPLRLDLGEAAFDLVEPRLEAHAPSASPSAAARSSAASRASIVRASSPASGMGSRSGSQLPSGAVSPLAARASCIEQMATSIIESSGCLVVMRLEPDAGQEEPAPDRVLATLGTPLEDLVRDRRDDRDEQDATEDGDPQLGPGEEAEEQDADEDEDDQELGAAARVRGGEAADVLGGEGQLVLQGVDGHVLRAVVLEDAADLAGPTDEQQVAHEDDDADEPLDEVCDEGLEATADLAEDERDAALRDEQRQQHEEADGQDRA